MVDEALGEALGVGEVLRGGHLEGNRVTGDGADAQAEQLDEPGIVGMWRSWEKDILM